MLVLDVGSELCIALGSKVGIVLGIALPTDVGNMLCDELGCDDGIVLGMMLAQLLAKYYVFGSVVRWAECLEES